MKTYSAITLHQPWASWIAWGLKTSETRTHNRFASLVGQRIAIHAGKAWSDHAFDMAAQVISEDPSPLTVERAERNIAKRQKMWGEPRMEYVRGAVLCLATVDDMRELDANDNQAALCFCGDVCADPLIGLFLTDVVQLAEPFPVRGKQAIWEVRLP